MTSVIMSVLLVSALKLFGNLGRSQQSLIGRESAGMLIVNLLAEIEQQNYQDPNAIDDTLGRETAEIATARANYNDIDDYHGWTANPPEDQSGQPYTRYSHLTRSVSVRYVAANDFTQTVGIDQGFKEVTITIHRTAGNEPLEERKFILVDFK
ncbi:MAG: hypothetical protein GY869_14410 [Planctomycetes bacterium]|nr:hypothetical protein [Planctomycetota bacterium]